MASVFDYLDDNFKPPQSAGISRGSADTSDNLSRFLNAIGTSEGADYDTIVGGKQKISDFSRHPNIVGLVTGDGPSTAAGKYQITGTTYRDMAGKLGITDFSPESQDRIAEALLKRRGALDDVINGDFEAAVAKLGDEWQSLPSGTSKNQGKRSQAFFNAALNGEQQPSRPKRTGSVFDYLDSPTPGNDAAQARAFSLEDPDMAASAKRIADLNPPTTWERVKQGFSNAVDSGKVSASSNPQDIASVIASGQKNKLPATAAARQMASEISPYVDRANKAEGFGENAAAWGSLIAKQVGQFGSNPKEFFGSMAESLPNSAPGLAGMLAGSAAGSAVAGPVGTLAGGIIGGTAGGYAIEQGNAFIDQVLKDAQLRKIDPTNATALTALITEKYPEYLSKSRLKGIGTAGTDAVLNRATLGMAGMGERAIAKEANALADAVKAGGTTAAQATEGLASLEAKNLARNTLGKKALRGTGITATEMVGEGASEAAGQLLAYGKADAGDVVNESLMGFGTGLGFAAAGKAINSIGGSAQVNDATTALANLRNSIVPEETAPAPLQIGNSIPEVLIGFPDNSVGTIADAENMINSLPQDQQVAMRRQLMRLDPQTGKRLPDVPSVNPQEQDPFAWWDEQDEIARNTGAQAVTPDDILKTATADDAIAAFTASVSTPTARKSAPDPIATLQSVTDTGRTRTPAETMFDAQMVAYRKKKAGVEMTSIEAALAGMPVQKIDAAPSIALPPQGASNVATGSRNDGTGSAETGAPLQTGAAPGRPANQIDTAQRGGNPATPVANGGIDLAGASLAANRQPALRSAAAILASVPRVQVGKDLTGWANQNAQFSRDRADKAGITEDIERLFSEGNTAAQVRIALKSRLGFVDMEEQAGFIAQVRATLGIPSQADTDGKVEFSKWKMGFDKRNAAKEIADVPAPATLQQEETVTPPAPVAKEVSPAELKRQKAKAEPDANNQAYSLPDNAGKEWYRSGAPDFEPSKRQKLVMDSVEKAKNDGVFYSSDMRKRIAKDLGISDDVLKSNTNGVDGGDFGYDLYLAEKAVDFKTGRESSNKVQSEMALKPGDRLGTLIFNDGKMNTGMTVESVEGDSIRLRGKRGSAAIAFTVEPTSIKGAIERAKERSKRKEGYADFVTGRSPDASASQKNDDLISAADDVESDTASAQGQGDIFAEPPAILDAEDDSATTSSMDQVATAKELMVGVREGDHMTAEDKKSAANLLKLYSLDGFDMPTATRILYIMDVPAAVRKKVLAQRPVSINDIADALAPLLVEGKQKSENDRLFNQAKDVANQDEKVRERLNIYQIESSILQSIAGERGMYGVKWAERNVGDRWTTQRIKTRKAKDALIAAVKVSSFKDAAQQSKSVTARSDTAQPTTDADTPATDDISDISDIPRAFVSSVKIDMQVYIEDENTFATDAYPANEALQSVRDDISAFTSLLNCLKG